MDAFFGTMRLTGDFKQNSENFSSHSGTVEENTWYFEILLLFLSLRYGADLGCSRLKLTNDKVVTKKRMHFSNVRKSYITLVNKRNHPMFKKF